MNPYPLGKNQSEQIKSKTGKSLKHITISNIMSGNINAEDIKISKETLEMQGEIGAQAGRPQIKKNFMRAGELTEVEDSLILKIYDMLRPYRATKVELLQIADRLENQYQAMQCADFIREAAEVYERRDILRKD